MNEIKKNAERFADKVTKKVINASKENKAVAMSEKINDDYRIKFDGTVILDDDDCKYVMNVMIEEKMDNGRFSGIDKFHKVVENVNRAKVFAEFYQELVNVLDGLIDKHCSVAEEIEQDELGEGAIDMFNMYMQGRVCEDFDALVMDLQESDSDTENEYIYSMFDWDYDIEDEWLRYITNMDDLNISHNYALEFYRENQEEFIGLDDICEWVDDFEDDEEGIGIDDNCCGSCLVYVKNPNWVNENAIKNDTPMLDEEIEKIEKIADEVFDELNPNFDKWVNGEDVETGFGDDYWIDGEELGCNFSEHDSLVDFIYNLDSRPAWVDRKVFDFKDGWDYLEIVMFGSYHIRIYYDPSDSGADSASADEGCGYGKEDLEYAVEIMDNRDMILALAEKAKIVKPSVEEIIENALESAMDDGNEYYNDKICQIGELYVSYTSPCDEFPNGCVCVVDEDGGMYGNWCNVSDSCFAVDFLVETLEKYNKDFNRVA